MYSGLYDLVRPQGWRVAFDVALSRAVRPVRVRRLGDELYEAGATR